MSQLMQQEQFTPRVISTDSLEIHRLLDFRSDVAAAHRLRAIGTVPHCTVLAVRRARTSHAL